PLSLSCPSLSFHPTPPTDISTLSLHDALPISKTFWFGDYEGSLIKQARTWVRSVPTAAERSSGFLNFSDLISLQSGTVGADVLGRSFPRGTVFDPATTRSLTAGQLDPVTGIVAARTGFVRDAFPGNQIPVSRID